MTLAEARGTRSTGAAVSLCGDPEMPIHLFAYLWGNRAACLGCLDLLRKSGEFPMSYEELDDTAATVYE